jgi:maltose alpha-D-glucosyltransferase/alpha-amylase
MLRSFEYAALAARADQGARGPAASPEFHHRLHAGARLWVQWVSASFLAGYMAAVRGAPGPSPARGRGGVRGPIAIVPADPRAAALLLDAYVVQKAAYEVTYELNNRPGWAWIPLTGILALLGRLNG